VLSASSYSVEDVFPYRGMSVETSPLLALWQRFDTNWYLRIAERGYSADDGSTVYFPLYPLLIRAVGTLLLGRSVLAAILISNIALVGALYFVYKIASDLVGEASARRAVVYLAIFPTSFFLFAGYTESVFLLLALASIYAGQRGCWWWAGALGALAALTRLQGVLLIVPLAYLFWRRRSLKVKEVSGEGLALLLIPAATLAFLAFTNLSLLTSYEGQLHAQFVMPWDNLRAAVTLLANGAGSFVDVLNLATTIIFAAMCFVIWRTLPRELGLYAFAMLLAPLFRMTTQQPLVSMSRYALAIFPAFILWGAWGKHSWVNRAILYLLFPLNLYLSAQFLIWGWVG
jgi:hypothetical protein